MSKELLANYNVPFYSPLDWFLNMGYIPPERAGKWTMIDAGLPRTQRGGFSRSNNIDLNAQSGAFGSGKPGKFKLLSLLTVKFLELLSKQFYLEREVKILPSD